MPLMVLDGNFFIRCAASATDRGQLGEKGNFKDSGYWQALNQRSRFVSWFLTSSHSLPALPAGSRAT